MREDLRRGVRPINGACDKCGAVCVNLTPKGDLPRGPYDEVLMDRLICDSCLDAELKAEVVQDAPVQEKNTPLVQVQQPFHGRWDITEFGVRIGTVIGDAVIGFTARDANGCILGKSKFGTSEDAINCILMTQA